MLRKLTAPSRTDAIFLNDLKVYFCDCKLSEMEHVTRYLRILSNHAKDTARGIGERVDPLQSLFYIPVRSEYYGHFVAY